MINVENPIFIKIPVLVLWEIAASQGKKKKKSGYSTARSILRAVFQDRDVFLGEFPMSQFPKLYKTSFCMTILKNVFEGLESKENP